MIERVSGLIPRLIKEPRATDTMTVDMVAALHVKTIQELNHDYVTLQYTPRNNLPVYYWSKTWSASHYAVQQHCQCAAATY
jgi:hypothetical protein